jgi:hypothetical protein
MPLLRGMSENLIFHPKQYSTPGRRGPQPPVPSPVLLPPRRRPLASQACPTPTPVIVADWATAVPLAGGSWGPLPSPPRVSSSFGSDLSPRTRFVGLYLQLGETCVISHVVIISHKRTEILKKNLQTFIATFLAFLYSETLVRLHFKVELCGFARCSRRTARRRGALLPPCLRSMAIPFLCWFRTRMWCGAIGRGDHNRNCQ